MRKCECGDEKAMHENGLCYGDSNGLAGPNMCPCDEYHETYERRAQTVEELVEALEREAYNDGFFRRDEHGAERPRRLGAKRALLARLAGGKQGVSLDLSEQELYALWKGLEGPQAFGGMSHMAEVETCVRCGLAKRFEQAYERTVQVRSLSDRRLP